MNVVTLEETMKKTPYIEKLVNLISFINGDVANNINNPFIGCEVEYLGDESMDMNVQWEISILDNGTITEEDYIFWHNKFYKIIAEYCKFNDSIDVLKRVVFLI